MKKLFLLFSISLILLSCGGNSTQSSSNNPSVSSVYQQLAAKSSVTASSEVTPTTQQQMVVAKLFLGMFNATPGAELLELCAGFLASGTSESELANLLAGTALFKIESLYPDSLSSQEFALRFMNNLVGTTVVEAQIKALAEQIAQMLDAGWKRGEIIWLVVSAFSNIPADNPDWGKAAAQLNNRLEVSDYYSAEKGLPSSDLTTLQAVMASVTDDPATVASAKAAIDTKSNEVAVYQIAAGKLMYSAGASFTLVGRNLDQGVNVTGTGACTSFTEQSGSTSASKTFSCIPLSTGNINVKVTDKNGAALQTTVFNIPSPQVTISTGKGAIVVELNPEKAPVTVNNFLRYVNEGFYSNTIFHRIVPGFVIQGGGYSTDGVIKTTHEPIVLEPPSATGLTNSAGTIAMARTAELNSATSQFFINTVNNNSNTGNNLDQPAGQGYAVFGIVVSGMDIVKIIETTPVADPTLASSYIAVLSMTQTR